MYGGGRPMLASEFDCLLAGISYKQ